MNHSLSLLVPSGVHRRRALPLALVLLFTLGSVYTHAQEAVAGPGDDVVELDEFVVNPLAEERIRSTNAKRESDTIADFVLTDQLGQFVDDDIGDIVERIPGVYTSGAGQSGGSGISVRGLRGDFNSLQLNGNRLPSNQGQTRGVSIDTVPAELIGGIEVYKSLTPDREADSVGGLVNIITKTGLDFEGRYISGRLGAGIYEIEEKGQYLAALNYADRLTENLGIYVAASYRKEDGRQRDEYDADPGDYVWEQIVTRDRNVDEITEENSETVFSFGRTTTMRTNQSQENIGLSVNLDYQPSDDMRLTFRTFFSEFNEDRPQWRVRWRFDRSDDDDPIGEEFGDSDFVISPEADVYYFGDDQRIRKRIADQNETEQIQSYQLAFSRTLDGGELNAQASFSKAERDLVSDQYLMETDDIPMFVDYRNREEPFFALLRPGDPNYDDGFNESDLFAPSFFGDDEDGFFEASERRNESILAEDEIQSVGVDYKHFLDTAMGRGYVKVGAKARFQDKQNNRDFIIVEEFNFDNAAVDYDTPMADFFGSDRIQAGIFPKFDDLGALNPTAPRDLIRQNLSGDPRADDVVGSVGQDFEISEDVIAAYVMGGLTGDRWGLLGGIRYEHTENDFQGYNVNEPLGFVPAFAEGAYNLSGSRSYDGFYPSIHYNYRPNDNLLLRVSLGRSLARPAFQEIFPSAYVEFGNEDDETELRDIIIRRGNTDLEPTESTNLDASIEYYGANGSLFSVAVFYKDVSNWIYEDTAILPVSAFPEYADVPNVDNVIVESFFNGDTAELTGLEFNAIIPLAMGFTFQGNYTIIDIDVNAAEVGLDRVPGQAEELYNVSLAYENNWLTTRLTYRWSGEIVDERITFGNDAAIDAFGASSVGLFQGEEEQLDLTVDARIAEGWTLFGRWRNITGDIERELVNNDERYPLDWERAGWDILAGVKFGF